MPKVAFIGAGSTVFARNLTVDLLSFDALRDSTELALMDIDEERLRTSESWTRPDPLAGHTAKPGRGSAPPPIAPASICSGVSRSFCQRRSSSM